MPSFRGHADAPHDNHTRASKHLRNGRLPGTVELKCSCSRTYNKVPGVELEGDAEPSQDIEPQKAIGSEAGGKVCHGDLTQRNDHSPKRQAPRVDDRNASRNPIDADQMAPPGRSLQVHAQPVSSRHAHRSHKRTGIHQEGACHLGRKSDHHDGHTVPGHEGNPVRVSHSQNTITVSESGSVTGPAKNTAVCAP